jgi:ferredoxin
VTEQLRVRVDQALCTGDGLCVQYAPDVFEFDVDGLAYVKDAAGKAVAGPEFVGMPQVPSRISA